MCQFSILYREKPKLQSQLIVLQSQYWQLQPQKAHFNILTAPQTTSFTTPCFPLQQEKTRYICELPKKYQAVQNSVFILFKICA